MVYQAIRQEMDNLGCKELLVLQAAGELVQISADKVHAAWKLVPELPRVNTAILPTPNGGIACFSW